MPWGKDPVYDPNAPAQAPAAAPGSGDTVSPKGIAQVVTEQAGGGASAQPTPDDVVLQHMASWLPGAAYLHNLTRLAESGATGGLSNRLDQGVANVGAYLGQKGVPYMGAVKPMTIQDAAAQTERARQAVGPIAAGAAEFAGAGASPFAYIGGPGWGSALAQGGAMGLAQGVGSSDNPWNWGLQTVEGLGLGAAGKAVAGAVQPLISRGYKAVRALAQPADVTASLKDTRDIAYDALKNIDVPDAQNAVTNAKAAIATADPGGALQQNAPRTMAELNRIQNRINTSGQQMTGQQAMNYIQAQRPNMTNAQYAAAINQLQKTGSLQLPGTQSAHDLITSIQNLDGYMAGAPSAENDLAPILKQHLNSALDSAGATPAVTAAKAAHQDYANAQFLQGAGEGLKYFGQSPAGDAAKIAQTYYSQGAADLAANRPTQAADAYKQLSKIANAAGGANAGQSSYGLVHGIVHPAVEGAAFATLPPGVAPAAAAAATYLGIKPALGALLAGREKAATQAAITNAYPDLTGQRIAAPDWRQAIRTMLLGPATGGVQ